MKHAGDQKSLYPLSQDHLGSRVGTRLTCDYSVLHSQHWDDSSRTEAMGETEGAANIFTNATLKMNKNEKWWESEQQGGEGEENWGGGVISLLFKRLRVRSTMIPPGPLTWQPCLSSIKANGCN